MKHFYLAPPASNPERSTRNMGYAVVKMINRNTVRDLKALNFMSLLVAEVHTGRLISADFEMKFNDNVMEYDRYQVSQNITQGILDMLYDVAGMQDIVLQLIVPTDPRDLNTCYHTLLSHVSCYLQHSLTSTNRNTFSITNHQGMHPDFVSAHQPVTIKLATESGYSFELVENDKPAEGVPTFMFFGKKMSLIIHSTSMTFFDASLVGLLAVLDKKSVQFAFGLAMKYNFGWILGETTYADLVFPKTSAKALKEGAEELGRAFDYGIVVLVPVPIVPGFQSYGARVPSRVPDFAPGVPVGGMGGALVDIPRTYSREPAALPQKAFVSASRTRKEQPTTGLGRTPRSFMRDLERTEAPANQAATAKDVLSGKAVAVEPKKPRAKKTTK